LVELNDHLEDGNVKSELYQQMRELWKRYAPESTRTTDDKDLEENDDTKPAARRQRRGWRIADLLERRGRVEASVRGEEDGTVGLDDDDSGSNASSGTPPPPPNPEVRSFSVREPGAYRISPEGEVRASVARSNSEGSVEALGTGGCSH
jgi:hypothetical protein